MKQVISAGVIVYRINEQDKREYLLLHAAKGHWDFAKGKQEDNETMEQTAHRELQEETGMSVQLCLGFQYILQYDFPTPQGIIPKTVILFLGQGACTLSVTLSPEHSEYIWLEYKEALNKLTFKTAHQALIAAECFLQT